MAIVDPAETKRAELAGSAGERASSAVQVSVVLPCLNEEETVAACVEKARGWFQRSGVRGEVLVVDNGSTDHSAEEARRAGARVIDEPKRGYGAAHLRGFAEAQGEVIVMADADDTYDLLDLDPLIEPLRNGYDMTVGNRMQRIEPGAMTWSHRVIGTPAISLLLRLFTGSRIADSQCGLRAFTQEAYQKMGLRSSGMELASEMILKAYRRGLKVAEVDTSYAVRKGETKLNTFRDGWRHLRFLLLYSPHYLFLVPGLVLMLLGILSLGITLGASGGVTIGTLTWQPVFAGGILLVVGTNAMVIGIATHLFAASRDIIPEDWVVRVARQYATLERMLGLAFAIVAIGAGLDALLFYEWVSGNDLGVSTAGLAAVAQTSMIVGANLALGGFLIALMDVE
ncbi:MAG: glycosyltransferase [Chloroflexi bacterium]|nr:glycosyltransferase [Chloroflexota bacterium]